jgi:FkbM family methyltransferase
MSPTTVDDGHRYKGRLTTVEVIALCFVVMVITVACMALVVRGREQQDPLLAALEQRYGPEKSSRAEEEWIIRDYFQDRRDGVFLDVGASHYKEDSNTYFLETSLGWSGIAIDAIQEFGADYKAHRPRTRFVAMFASDVTDSTVQFFVADNHPVSSSDPEFIKRYGTVGKPREVPTTTLNAVLEQAGISKVDFMSMDIELAEPKALAGFDIPRFRPDLVCIEAHPEVRQQILDYFARYGYTVVGKYLRADAQNLYFRPLSPQ